MGNDPHPDIITSYNTADPKSYVVREITSTNSRVSDKRSSCSNNELSGVTYAFLNQFDASVYKLNSDGEKIYAKQFFNEPGRLKYIVQAWDSTPGDGAWDNVRTDYYEVYGGGRGRGVQRSAYSIFETEVMFGTISELI